jgi:hypothetical protein
MMVAHAPSVIEDSARQRSEKPLLEKREKWRTHGFLGQRSKTTRVILPTLTWPTRPQTRPGNQFLATPSPQA